MRIGYSGKSIVITGSGIGRASALLFAQLGAKVVATDVNEETLRETVEAIAKQGGSVESLVADVTDPDEAAGVVKFACSKFRVLDILFNNAGGSFPTPMEEISREEFQRIRANAIAPSAASPGLIAWLKTTPGGVEGFAAKQPMGRLGTPEEIASVAALLASEYAGFINGVVIPVDGGIEAKLAVTG